MMPQESFCLAEESFKLCLLMKKSLNNPAHHNKTKHKNNDPHKFITCLIALAPFSGFAVMSSNWR